MYFTDTKRTEASLDPPNVAIMFTWSTCFMGRVRYDRVWSIKVGKVDFIDKGWGYGRVRYGTVPYGGGTVR